MRHEARNPPGPPERTIDKTSSVPYYRQLQEILREQVTSGLLQPGDRLDGEHALCRRYGVSRPVVRQALAGLYRENVLDRVKGQGIFVPVPRTPQSLVQYVHGLYDDVHAMGRTLHSEVRQMVVQPADAAVSRRLQVPVDAPVVLLERLRFVDDEPWVYAISHIPFALAPDLVNQDLSHQSLYQLLFEKYGHGILRSDRAVEAQRADGRMAKDLQIPAGDPVLKLTSVSFGDNEAPIETFVAYHRADRSRFEVSLTRSELGHPPAPMVRLI